MSPQEPLSLALSGILTWFGLFAVATGAREIYALTPAPDGSANPPLQSKHVALNGVTLAFVGPEKTELPPLLPAKLPGGGALTLLPLSYGFVVLPQAQAAACK